MTTDKFSPTRRSVLRLGAMSALGVGIGIPAVSGSVAATSCPRTPGYWANHPEREEWDSDGVKRFQEVFEAKYEYTLDASNLLDPSKGDKTLIMAKHLMATILNFQGRKKDNYEYKDEDGDVIFVGDKCVDAEIKYGPYAGSKVRTVKQDAEEWFMDAQPKQKKWTLDGLDGEAIKDTLDAFNNNPRKLGLYECPCRGDD